MIKMQEIDIKEDDVGNLYRFRQGFYLPASDIDAGIPDAYQVRAAKFLDRERVLRLFVTMPAERKELRLLPDWEFCNCKVPHAFLYVEVLSNSDRLIDLDGRDFVCEHEDKLIFASVRA